MIDQTMLVCDLCGRISGGAAADPVFFNHYAADSFLLKKICGQKPGDAASDDQRVCFNVTL